jgi:hypothetical protein
MVIDKFYFFIQRTFGITTDAQPFKRELDVDAAGQALERAKYNLLHKETKIETIIIEASYVRLFFDLSQSHFA